MIKKMYLLFGLLIGLISDGHAQAPAVKWQNSAITDTVVKTKAVDENGNEYVNTYAVDDELRQLLGLPDGNFIGLVRNTSFIARPAKLVKFTANGDTISVKKPFDGIDVGSEYNKSMVATRDGGFAFVGILVEGAQSAIGILKLDADGNRQWLESYRCGQDIYGGEMWATATSIVATDDGGYLLVSASGEKAANDQTDDSKGSTDFWVLKLDATGLIDWEKTVGGSGSDVAVLAQQAEDGGYLIAGHSDSPKSGDKSDNPRGGEYDQDLWVVKLDDKGNKQWDKTIGGGDAEYLAALNITQDGGFILGSITVSGIGHDKTSPYYSEGSPFDMWVIKCGATGAIQWQQGLGGTGGDRMDLITVLADGSCVVAGRSGSPISGTKTVGCYDPLDAGQDFFARADYWLVKIDPAGKLAWQKGIGGTGLETQLGGILPTADGGLLVAGGSQSGISGMRTVAQKGYSDIWFLQLGEAELPVSLLSFTGTKLNGAANLVWTTATEESFSRFELQKQAAPGHFASLAKIAAKGNNSRYGYTDKLDEGINYYRLKMVDKDGSVEYSGVVTINENSAAVLIVRPNPVTQGAALIVRIPEASQQSYIQVMSLDGKVLITRNIAAGATTVRLNTDALAKGTYFLIYVNNNGRLMERFVKQ